MGICILRGGIFMREGTPTKVRDERELDVGKTSLEGRVIGVEGMSI